MNGRALNEKAIEVSPSSHAVLDRAAEVLTPFPPSKNRPRPGDWTCPSCGFSNFQRRTACFRCSYPAMGAAPPSDPNMGYPYGYPPAPPPMMHGNYSQGMTNRQVGGSAPFRPGDWTCSQMSCRYHNFAKNVSCLRCGSSRANAVIIGSGPPPTSEYPPNPQVYSGYDMSGGHDHAGGPPGPPGPPGPGGPGGHMGGFQQAPGAFAPFGPGAYGVPSGGPSMYRPMAHGFPAPNAGQGHPGASGFDRAEAAFSSAGGNTGPGAQGPGPSGFSNGGAGGGYEGQSDPFSFLGPSLGALSIDDNRRNGAVGQGGTNQG
jgi:hypothetical protein